MLILSNHTKLVDLVKVLWSEILSMLLLQFFCLVHGDTNIIGRVQIHSGATGTGYAAR